MRSTYGSLDLNGEEESTLKNNPSEFPSSSGVSSDPKAEKVSLWKKQQANRRRLESQSCDSPLKSASQSSKHGNSFQMSLPHRLGYKPKYLRKDLPSTASVSVDSSATSEEMMHETLINLKQELECMTKDFVVAEICLAKKELELKIGQQQVANLQSKLEQKDRFAAECKNLVLIYVITMIVCVAKRF